MLISTKEKILNFLYGIENGTFFTVTFKKRNSDEIRVMNCRFNVKKHLKGGTLRYDPKSYDLLSVWDPKAHKLTGNGYRMIPLEGIQEIKFQNKIFTF